MRTMCHGSRGQGNVFQALLFKTPAPTTGSRGRVTRIGRRRVYPLVSDLNTDRRQQMQSRFRARPIQEGEFMMLPFIPPTYGQAEIKERTFRIGSPYLVRHS
jgi:hypothetical protein